MSNHVTSLLRRKRLGVGFSAKSIILLMGDLASDDGSGIWASKPTMAKELETSDRTVQRNIHALIEAGLVSEVGKRKHKNGETIEYRIEVEAVEMCPDCKDAPPTQRHRYTQDVEREAQDIAPDRVSPLTERHPTPDRVSGVPPTECHPNQKKPNRTYCAADASHHGEFDFGSFFDRVWRACPNKDHWAATEEAVKALIDAGEQPGDVLAATEAYRKRVAGYDPQRIKLSQNFFAGDFWRAHVPAAEKRADPQKVLEARAADIRARKPWARTILPSQAGECIQENLITLAECRAAGINV
ncbi:hypothetical protein RA19_00275 [Leisingera sp. ANG-M1]|uniref:helix-turn-helix domain-containing protein n=1 Tax=Leisingera sp. ANG-M1 TaxID=1577895 RepID=UPI00058043DF|nr:helix-turn-helix domain-containing protein [Leisingera sp. ANG-M1]KIC12877.1 hypothetical protein RA19_00275 [Leisingera sp. ANG-M1]